MSEDLNQLDELVAQHVMEWKNSGPMYWEVKMGTTCLYAPKDKYSFTTTGDGMMLVIEKMQERGWLAEIHVGNSDVVVKFKQQVDDPVHMGNAEISKRMSIAVAKAALRALNVAF